MTILVVSDDAVRREALMAAVARALPIDPARPPTAACATDEAMLAVVAYAPTAAVLDAPDSAALGELLTRLRGAAEAALPVVALLPDGAAELVERAALRPPALAIRRRRDRPQAVAEALTLLLDGGATVDVAFRYDRRARLLSGGGQTVALTPLEAQALDLLLDAGGQVVPQAELCSTLWGRGAHTIPVDAHLRAALRTHIHGLRGKLRQVNAPLEIRTRRNVGYAVWRAVETPGATAEGLDAG